MLSIPLFYISAIIIFVSDVFARSNDPQIDFFVALSAPFLIFLLAKIEKKKIIIPWKESTIYLLFIILSTVSTFFAIDKEIAIRSLLIYIAGYAFFVLAFNYQEVLNKHFKWFLVAISVFSCLIFLADRIFNLSLFSEGASLFYGGYYHNELGNLLVLGIVIGLYDKLPILLLFFLPFFVFSYSRTAYLSLIFISILFLFIKKKVGKFNQKIILLNIILIGVILFFNTTKEVNKFFPQPVKNFVEKKLLLPKEKSFTGKRQQHYYYALLTVLDKPLFGVGPGNLYFSTLRKQFNWEEGTTSAHNILLDIFAENGILAGTVFLLFLWLVFKKLKKNLYFYLFLSLGIIFLFNFTYRYTSVFIIWFILAGISFRPSQNDREVSNIFILFTAILFVISQVILVFGLSRFKAINNLEKGIFYDKSSDKKNAIFQYKEAIYGKPTNVSTLLTKIFYLNTDVYGYRIGKSQTEQFIGQFKKDFPIPKQSDVGKIIKDFCYDYNLKCP